MATKTKQLQFSLTPKGVAACLPPPEMPKVNFGTMRSRKDLPVVSNPADLAAYVRRYSPGDKEIILGVAVDKRNHVLKTWIHSHGDAGQAAVYTSGFMRECLEVREASGFVLAHNHPAGSLTPSFQDRELTRRFIIAAEALSLDFLDHLIVTADEMYSFKQNGLMDR